jgi:arylsulfatase A-like enzyme
VSPARHVPIALLFALLALGGCAQHADRAPNVVFIITDDQGYGDLACHGNKWVKTPNIDRLARESVEFTRFYSQPVCSPTRAGLLTGRHYYRTGVTDTYLGRSMMHNDEITLPEVLRNNGYATALFGKWHLGDCYPMRPMEQGFDHALYHRGGGMVQPGDPPDSSYMNPILQLNGQQQPRAQGYCTDVFTDAALSFIQTNKDKPFFAWLAFNAPHTPLEVPDEWVKQYLAQGLDPTTVKIYAMVQNIDQNVGRIMSRLRELNLENDTILVFMTDNGPQQRRYNANLRGLKGTVYEGGIRVPFMIRYPRKLKAGTKIDQMASHLDLTPTMIDLCGAQMSQRPALDGASLTPLLLGKKAKLPERRLVIQWHRGDVPLAYNNCAVITLRWKLVNGNELYDIQNDRSEKNDLATNYPDIVRALRDHYDRWFAEIIRQNRFQPPRIILGSDQENPVTLTRQDWRGPDAGWNPASTGHWEVEVERIGTYTVTVRFGKLRQPAQAALTIGDRQSTQPAATGAQSVVFENVTLQPGPTRLRAVVAVDGKDYGAGYVDVQRR